VLFCIVGCFRFVGDIGRLPGCRSFISFCRRSGLSLAFFWWLLVVCEDMIGLLWIGRD